MRALQILLLVAVAATAQAEPQECYRVGGKRVCLVEVRGARVDSGCAARPGECASLKLLSQARAEYLGAPSHGGANPGAVICQNMGAGVEIGQDALGNQVALCRASDGSLATAMSYLSKLQTGR